jgi:hypothetical protein
MANSSSREESGDHEGASRLKSSHCRGALGAACLRQALRSSVKLLLIGACRLLGIIYADTANGEPAALDAITKQLLDEYQHRLPPGDPGLFAGLAAAAIRNTLADLARHGPVIVTGASHELDPHQAAAAASQA